MQPDVDDGGAPRASEVELETLKALRAHELMLNEATSAFEHAAIAPLLVINGGGAVAFLTLLGAVADKQKSGSVHIVTGWALAATAAWGLGLVAAACAASLGYRAQRGFSKAHRLRRDAAEQRLLVGSNIAEVVRSSDYDASCWRENAERETGQARHAGDWYSRARWASIACFVVGVACAGVSVL